MKSTPDIETTSTNSDHDYLGVAVPEAARRSWLDLLVVWMGFLIVVGIMTVGGGLTAQLGSFRDVVVVVLVGNLILGGFAALAGVTGAVSGKSFSLLLRDTFPGASWKLASLYVPLVLIGWYAIEVAIFAYLIAKAFELPRPVEMLFAVLAAGLFSASSYVGIRSMIRLSYVLVPLIIGLGIWAITLASRTNAASFGFGEPISASSAISIVVGTWVMGALTCMQDMTRFSRSGKSSALIAAGGIILANSFTLLVGAAAAALTKQADPAEILLAAGLILPGIVFSFSNIWNTNDNNLYSASLHAANLFGTTRHRAVILCTFLGAALAIFRPFELGVLFTFLLFLGSTAPALGAVVLARYWYVVESSPGASAVAAWLGWIGGTLLATSIGGTVPYLAGFLGGGLIYLAVMRLCGAALRFRAVT